MRSRSSSRLLQAPSRSGSRGIADARQLKAAALIHATRVAVTGRGGEPRAVRGLELVGPRTGRCTRDLEQSSRFYFLLIRRARLNG